MATTTLAIGSRQHGKSLMLAQRIIEIADDGGRVVLLTHDLTDAARFIFRFKLDLWAPHIEVVEITPR